jgi:5-methylcytosine-specific restriction endonuclease McrA
MIRLSKKAVPAVLQQNFVAWTDALKNRMAAGEQPTDAEKTRYRHADIKTALVIETAGKCAYCESKLRHIAYGDVEHIIPKVTDLEKTFEWSNLTLACDICNTNKGTHFGNHQDLVDPYAGEPSLHLNFVGAAVFARPGSHPGIATETTLKLNRIDLVERRMDRLSSLVRQLHLIVEVANENTKAILRRDLETNELTADREYAAMARAFVSEELRKIDAAAQLQ